MERCKVIIIMMIVLGLFFTNIFAAGVGCLDIQKVFFSYDEAQKMQKDFAKKEKKYKEKVEQKQEELLSVQNDREKYKKLKRKIEDELEKEKEELLDLNQKLTQELKDEILKAVEKVAKDYALDTIVDKQVMLYGGIDVTDWVIETLNKK